MNLLNDHKMSPVYDYLMMSLIHKMMEHHLKCLDSTFD